MVYPDVLECDVVVCGDTEACGVRLAESLPRREGVFDGVPETLWTTLGYRILIGGICVETNGEPAAVCGVTVQLLTVKVGNESA